MHRVIRIGLCIACCWVLIGTAAAQQSSQATAKPNPPNAQATPIPLSEIAAQGESASDVLRNIDDGLSTDQVTVTIEKRLPQLVNEIELRIAEMNKLLAASLPLEFLHFPGSEKAAQRGLVRSGAVMSRYMRRQMAVLLPDRVIVRYLFIAKESRTESGYSEVVMPGFYKLVQQKRKPLTGFYKDATEDKIRAESDTL